MTYFNGYQPAYAPNPGFQQFPNYQQQRMDYLQSMQQQPGELQARTSLNFTSAWPRRFWKILMQARINLPSTWKTSLNKDSRGVCPAVFYSQQTPNNKNKKCVFAMVLECKNRPC